MAADGDGGPYVCGAVAGQSPAYRARAVETFRANRAAYHNIAATMIDKDYVATAPLASP